MKSLAVSQGIFLATLAVSLLLTVGEHLTGAPIVLQRFSSEKPDPQMENLLYLAAGTELVQAGLSSTRNAANPLYVLSAQYSTTENAVTVSYVLSGPAGASSSSGRSTSPDAALAKLDFEADLDQTIDSRVADAVRQLLQSAGIACVNAPDAYMEGVISWPPPVRTPPVQTPAEETGLTAPAVQTEPRVPGEPGVTVSFDSSVSTAGVFFVGGLSQYTRLGLAATLGAGASFLWQTWTMGVDGRFQLIRAFNNQGMIGGPLYFFLLGPDIKVGAGRTSRLRLTGDLSGGAALISVFGPSGSMTKTRPYADAGLYAGILLGDSFSVGGEARFTMIFDQDVLVMGVSPAASFRMEL